MKQTSSSQRDWLAVLALLLLSLAIWTLAWQVKRPILVDIGGGYDTPFVANYFKREGLGEGETTYRWADAYSAIRLPGVGIGNASVQLQLSAPGSPMLPLPAVVHLNGVAVETISITAQSAPYTITVPPSLIAAGGDGGWSGDLIVYLRADSAPRAGDNRAVAFQADFARLTWGDGFVMPAPWQLLWLTIGLLLLYSLMRRLDLGTRLAAIGSVVYVLVVAGLLVFFRLGVTSYSDGFVAAMAITHLALWPAGWLLGWTMKHVGLASTSRLRGVLLGAFAATLAIKLGGLYHPLAFVVDAEFHLTRIQEVAKDFWLYYSPPGLALRVMPEGDWRTRAIIPYSPFFYMINVPFTWLPLPLDKVVYAVSALFDAVRPMLIAFIALRFGWGERVAGYAATLFAFIPATFLWQQWGNWPTNLSLTLTLLFVAQLTGSWPALNRRALGWLTLILTITFLSYTVSAVFLGLTIVAIIALGGGRELLARMPVRRPALGVVSGTTTPARHPTSNQRKEQLTAYLKLLAILVVATVLATLLFYGQYVNLLITETLPNLGQTVVEEGTLKPDTSSWPEYLLISAQTMLNYSLWPIYIVGGFGLLLLLLRERGELKVYGKALLVSFVLVGGLVFILNYYADMAMKQYWWGLPALALAGGWLLGKFSRWADGVEDERGRLILYALPMVVIVGFILNSLLLFADRLFLHNRS